MQSFTVWLKGLTAAAVSGVAGALGGLTVTTRLHDLEKLFLVAAAIGAAGYLKRSPLPCKVCEE